MRKLIFITVLAILSTQTNAQQNINLSTLTQGQVVNGFKTMSIYLNDADQPMGGRFVHEATGFTLDLLQMESVPQTFIWVRSFPVSDMGEPHTQEHLLVGKGNKGRYLSTSERMSLAQSSAFTQQLYTAYHLNTVASSDVFFKLFEDHLDALLNPDYTEEEIKREVRNWGITQNADKTLRLEEKGSVYNEMSATMANPFSLLYRGILQNIYGSTHPLAYNSGGLPAAIRQMKPDDIRRFHDANYQLGNMGAIVSLAKNVSPATTLATINETLNRLDPHPQRKIFVAENGLPSAQGAMPGKIDIIEYGLKNEQDRGNIVFGWPATLNPDVKEAMLIYQFFGAVAGDANTNLYKKLIDTKTRSVDIDAQGVFSNLLDGQGRPMLVGVTGVASKDLTKEKAILLRTEILAELKRIAAFKDGSPELNEFNKRVQSNLLDAERSTAKFVNSPPRFGSRGIGSEWIDQLRDLNTTKDFHKSVVYKPQYAQIRSELATGKNIWRDYLAKWKYTETEPFAVISKASSKLLDKEEAEKKQRADAEVSRLKEKYNLSDDQAAIQKYKEEYDANSTELEKLEKATRVEFIKNPPLSMDEQLNYKQKTLGGNVKMTASTFDNMSSATTGIALKLNGIKQDQLKYLAMLPDLLTGTGVIMNGKPVSYEDMSEMLKREILALQCNFNTNPVTGRVELQIQGSGNNIAESQKAVKWMQVILQSPNWKKENLSRIRDLVDQALTGLRRRMQGSFESWVTDPQISYWKQDNPLYLSTSSFLTRTFNIHRLRWMLKDAGGAENLKTFSAFMTDLGDAKSNRDDVKKFLAFMQGGKPAPGDITVMLKRQQQAFEGLSGVPKDLAIEAAKDLDQLLNDIPDGSLTNDWFYLCSQIRNDLSQTPEKTLNILNDIRKQILIKGNARMFVVGSVSSQQKLEVNINALLSTLKDGAAGKTNYSTNRLIDQRLKDRMPEAIQPVYVGLFSPNARTGVFQNSAPLTSYKDLDKESLLRFLAAQLYAGGGPQSVFSKTIGAGLAYSNGVGISPRSGRISYYAERTPELPQTLRFVIDEVKRSVKDPGLTEYIIAGAIAGQRSANSYESRADAMAVDLEEGVTPEVISRFRKAVLEFRNMPGLMDEVFKRKDLVYEKILPGYGIKGKDVNGAVYYVIGNDKQMSAYEAYLQSVEGKETKLFRLFPRDYWIIE